MLPAIIVFLTGLLIYSTVLVIFLSLHLILGFLFCARVLSKAGFSIWWSVALFFPPALVVLIWLMAFADWPARGPSMVVYRAPHPPRA